MSYLGNEENLERAIRYSIRANNLGIREEQGNISEDMKIRNKS